MSLPINRKLFLTTVLTTWIVLLGGCSQRGVDTPGAAPTSLGQVPSVRLNYRYEPDVPPPDATKDVGAEERNPAVQTDFDQNRPQEVLDKTLTSHDGKRIVAIYHRAGDLQSEFRLDMYTSDGRILKKVTADAMAVHFPDTIRWSPDSSNLAFVAMTRGASLEPAPASPGEEAVVKPSPSTDAGAGAAIPATPTPATIDPEANANVDLPPAAATPSAPTGILTFRTEQIYICNADGDGAKALTQNEGLIYFYYVWSPDSSMLAAVATKSIEWRYLSERADLGGEIFVPVGRPRVIEKNGRERRLDDALTAVQPVWSPDSSKVACAFEHQVRIYDADVTSPTQAAVPLRNNLLLSSQAYDLDQAAKLNAENVQTDTNTATNTNANQATTLPYESPVSFNPIVALNWTADDLLYFQTAYIKRMKNDADSVTSFQRWHRLILTAQLSNKL